MSQEFSLPYVVHDAIHGQIRMTTDERMAVMNHPLFQRLHRLRQTSLLSYVWPGATHTRFAHSLGVLEMADRLFGAVMRRSESSAQKLYSMEEAQCGQAVRLTDLKAADPQTWIALRTAIRMTALVHDLGHGPLSHLFDQFAPSKEQIHALLDDDRFRISGQMIRACLLESKESRADHEVISAVLFSVLATDVALEPWLVVVVTAVLLGRSAVEAQELLDAYGKKSLMPFISFIRDLVSSAPLDADRMDYLERDSRATGVNYGLYDRERLLKTVLCVRDSDSAVAYRLGWRASGLRAVEHVVQARFHMFAQVYYHKTNHATITMLAEIGRIAQEHQIFILDASSVESLVKAYEDQSDELFLKTLAGVLPQTIPMPSAISDLAKQILSRKLWKCLYEFDRDEAQYAGELLQEMQKRCPEAALRIESMPLKATKDLDQGASFLKLDRTGRYQCAPERSWLEISPSIRVLRDEEKLIVRLFLRTEGSTSPEEILRLKKMALELLHTFSERARIVRAETPTGGWAS